MAVNLQSYLQQHHPQPFQAKALPEAQALPASVQTATLTMLQKQSIHTGGNGPSMLVSDAMTRLLHGNQLHRIVDKGSQSVSAKVTSMLDEVTPQLTGAEKRNLTQRLNGLTPKEAKTLEEQLHIPKFKVRDSAQRVQIRAGILNALAKNADLKVTGELRDRLIAMAQSKKPHALSDALTALARPGASVRGVIDRLAHDDRYAAVLDEAIRGSFDNIRATKQNDATVKAATAKVDTYVNKNLKALGLEFATDKEIEIAKKELVAVSVYTHDDGFRKVNNLMRGGDTSHLTDEERQSLEVYARAITNGLARLPEYQGLSFRNVADIGTKIPPTSNISAQAWAEARYTQGAKIAEEAVTSSTPEGGFTGREVRFAIHSAHGKETGPISLTPKDGFEATFRPNTRFEVLASQKHLLQRGPGAPPVPVQFVVMKEADDVPDPGTVL